MARVAKVYTDSEVKRIRIVSMANEEGANVVRIRDAAKHFFRKLYNGNEQGFAYDVLACYVAQHVENQLGHVPDTTIAEEIWLAICDGLRKGREKHTIEEGLRLGGDLHAEAFRWCREVLALIS